MNKHPKGMNQSEYARHRAQRGLPGQRQPAVSKALKQGRISLNEHGLIDPDVADLAWARNSQRQRVAQPGAEPAATEPSPEPPQVLPEKLGSGPQAYQRARAMREVYQAEIARLKVEKEKGELVDRAEVERSFAEALSALRTSLLGLGVRLMSDLVAVEDEREARALVDREVRETLEALAKAFDAA